MDDVKRSETELLSVEVSTKPVSLKNSSPNQVQQVQISKCYDDEEIKNFKASFGQFHGILGTIGWAVMAFCFLSSQFTGPSIPSTCASKDLRNIYDQKFTFDFHAFISENETDFDEEKELVWRMPKLTYGDLQSTFSLSMNVSISEVCRLGCFLESIETKPEPTLSAYSEQRQPLSARLPNQKRLPTWPQKRRLLGRALHLPQNEKTELLRTSRWRSFSPSLLLAFELDGGSREPGRCCEI